MKLALAHIIDALCSFELLFSEDHVDLRMTVERVEHAMGQQIEPGVLYISNNTSSEDVCLSLPTSEFLSIDKPEQSITVRGAAPLEVANAICRYQMRVETLLEEMRERYYENKDLQGLCEALSRFVGNPVLAYDDALMPIAQTEFPREFAFDLFGTDHLSFEYAFKTIPDWKRDLSSDPLRSERATMTENPDRSVITATCNVLSNGEFQGFLEIFQSRKPITTGEMLLLEPAAKIVSTLYPFRDNQFVLSHLAGHPVQRALTESWLSALRWQPDDGVYVVALDLPYAYAGSKINTDLAVRMLRALIPQSANAMMGQTPVIVANARYASRDEAINSIVSVLKRARSDVYVGVSEVMRGIDGLHEGFVHAQFAAHAARTRAEADFTLRFEDCRFAFLVEVCAMDENRKLILDTTVVQMFADDTATGSENTLTVKTFIETGFNLAATARSLSVHRNTVAYRLRHVAQRYGLDLSSPIANEELVFQTLLSCKLLTELDQ